MGVYSRRQYLRQCLNLDHHTTPTLLSSKVSQHSIIMFAALCLPLSLMVRQPRTAWYITLSLMFTVLKMVSFLTILARQPQDTSSLAFRVPGVPFLPCLSILINVFLTMMLSWQTWVRFAVWMSVGLLVYGGYGWWNSSEEYRMKGQIPPNELTDVDTVSMESFEQ